MFENLNPIVLLAVIVGYFLLLLIVSYFTGRDNRNSVFFLAGRKSPWFVVAFGMIGASLSGVTFISIPGAVGATPEMMEQLTGTATVRGNTYFSYMQVVFGYLLGYAFIVAVLLPLYYRMNLTSIYGYLESRFGFFSYKTGAAFFLLSRTIGAALRLLLVSIVLQKFVLEPLIEGFPFWLTVLITILLIWVYTFRGGIRTIVWTDTLQTFFMLLAMLLTIFAIGSELEAGLGGLVTLVSESEYSKIFFFEGGWQDPNNFFKQFISGALITIAMTGLDQDMMQKNLSVSNLKDSQKNMISFSIVLVFVNFLFLTLGALLYLYAAEKSITIPGRTDYLYPILAFEHLSPAIGVIFILGLTAAAYSSADSALTSLTTSFCIDFLNFEKHPKEEKQQRKTRLMIHLGFSVLFLIIILFFNSLDNNAIINNLFYAAGYTYGPLLGLFAFGLFTKWQVKDQYVLPICIAAPILAYLINTNSDTLLAGFQLGFLILPLTGLLTFIGMVLIRLKE